MVLRARWEVSTSTSMCTTAAGVEAETRGEEKSRRRERGDDGEDGVHDESVEQ